MGEADDTEAGEKPKFVFPKRVGEEDADEEQDEPLAVLLYGVPVADAVAYCERLEREGIPCGARDSAEQPPPAGDGLTSGPPLADVYVRAEELQLAQETLSRPAEESDEEDETAAEREARYVANWICPRCERPGLDLLPPSRGQQHLRVGCLAVLAMPMLLGLLAMLLPSLEQVDHLPGWAYLSWLVVVLCLVWACVLPERMKRCKGCGWVSGQEHPTK
jgi:hypothetical protein